MFNKKKKSHLSIELNDYVLRAILVKGTNLLESEVFEVPLERDVIESEMIVNEMALYEIFKEHVVKWGGKHQNVRIFVPDTSVLMKTFEHPAELAGDKLKSYVQMEIGRTIHLPFQEPLIDVHDAVEGDGHAVLYAAPSEEITKLVSLVMDVHMTPQVADVRALCNVRFLDYMNLLNHDKTYLIADWSIHELSLCIISKGEVEFLRFQSLETDMNKWQSTQDDTGDLKFSYTGNPAEYRALVTDQILEIDRMMNFFKFSLHKGDREVDEILVMGDNPFLDLIANYLGENLSTKLKIVDDALMHTQFPNFPAKYASLLGLALKEVN